MAAQELVRFYENRHFFGQIDLGGGLGGAVGLRVALILLAEAQTEQDAQAVGVESEDGKRARKEEDLFGAGIADRRELLRAFRASAGGPARTPERLPSNSSCAIAAISRSFSTVAAGVMPRLAITWSTARGAARILAGFNPVRFFSSANASFLAASLAR